MNRIRVLVALLVITLVSSALDAGKTVRAQAPTEVAPATVQATATTLTLTPLGDTLINSTAPALNFGSQVELVVSKTGNTLLPEARALLRFDLTAIPAGATIQRATLRLHQIRATSGNWTLNLARITTDWNANTVTWNARPTVVAFPDYTFDAPAGVDIMLTVDVISLVEGWVYTPGRVPNYGFELSGVTVIGASITRTFDSMEGTVKPELIIDYTAAPTAVTILEDTAPVKIDANCPREEYANAATLNYVDAFAQVSTIFLKHDADNIYVCVQGVVGRFGQRFFGVYLDTDFGREKFAEPEDLSLQVSITTNTGASYQGTGNPDVVYTPLDLPLGTWEATATSANADVAEYRIARSLIAPGCSNPFGLGVYHHWVNDNNDDYGLPPGQTAFNTPVAWLQATLQNPRCVRVCSETSVPCTPVPGATVFKTASGAAFSLDTNGYVIGSQQLANGDTLWATLPITADASSTLYYTSGEPALVSDEAFNGSTGGTMTLVVTQKKPLLVHNLDVSAEWYVQGDPQSEAWLRENIIKAANYFYAFTDGQFALGQITVHQSLDAWQDADLRLHINNILQPKAIIGGIVPTDTLDPSPVVSYTYSAGHFFMGSHWNRYGVPPNQPVTDNGVVVPPAIMADDWALAMAHELGHYLLFLFDTYTDVDGNASQELAELCTGSAMGDVYKPGNQNYIYDLSHWNTACSGTEAYQKLNGRSEWQTIKTWYPWAIQPTGFVTGPVAPPINLTTVNFVIPSTPPGEPATSQVFDMLYQDGELTSGEARVFTLRGDRVYEQGKPPKNATQVTLIDAQVADRLCVYDVNDHAEGSETPRHQFGCELIQPGDAELMMTKNVAWGPLVKLTQTGPNQVSLVVTNPLTTPLTAQVMARLYPEHGLGYPPLALTGSDGVYSGVFDLPEPVSPLYAQLWVEETPAGLATRREVMVDRGTGGSGAFGPAKQFGGVLIVSSDGKASFETDQPFELLPGQSISWGSMPGTPDLPADKNIIGQSYRLDAYPVALVESGTVHIQYEGADSLLQAASAGEATAGNVSIYFWDGNSWQAVNTTISTPNNSPDGVKLASAPSQGVGVYAVLEDASTGIVYLPLIQR